MKNLFYLLALAAIISCSGDEDNTLTPTVIQLTIPELSTTVASNITQTTAQSGGTIISNGGSEISSRGIVWNTQQNPTISLTTKTTDGSGDGTFTSSIANLIPETTYFVRAYATNNVGTAYGNEVSFSTENITWGQIGQDIDGETLGDNSGFSVALSSDGNIVAIGAIANSNNRGHVRVYQNNGGVWQQLGQDIDGEALGDSSGFSVALSSDGNILAVGAYFNDGNGDNSGHVRIYQNNSGDWQQIGQDIDGEASGSESGTSVAISSNGNIVAIGAPYYDNYWVNDGHVRVYQNNGGVWQQIGQDISGSQPGSLMGAKVSLSSEGNILAVDSGNTNSISVFQNNGGDWQQIGQSIATTDVGYKSISICANGMFLAVGVPAAVNSSGYVRVYENNGGVWQQIGQDIDGDSIGDAFGHSVSLSEDGSTIAIGAPSNLSGYTKVYKNITGVWQQIGLTINGEAPDDSSGFSVALSSDGTIVAIGAHSNDGNGDNSGHVRVYNTGN